MTATVVIADRSPFVRLAVRAALMRDGMNVVAEVDAPSAALQAVIQHRPDVVLWDAELDDDMTMVGAIHAAVPAAALIVLSPDESESRALCAVRAGACGFLPKHTAPDRLPAVVRGVLAGEAAIPRRLVRRLLHQVHARETRRLGAATETPAESLTSREWEVIELLAAGHVDRTVSQRLGVSEVTVRRHAASAARKLHAERREEAVEMFRRLVA